MRSLPASRAVAALGTRLGLVDTDGTIVERRAVELGDGADTFAYPFGAYNDDAVRAVEQAGLLIAFTTQTGTTASWPTRLTTPRVHVGATMTVEQLLRAMGAAR